MPAPAGYTELRARAKELYLGGMSLPDVAQEVGAKFKTVASWCTAEDWKGLRAQIALTEDGEPLSLTNRASVESVIQKVTSVIDSAPSLTRKRAMQASLKAARDRPKDEQAAIFDALLRESLLHLPILIAFLPPADLLSKADKIAKLVTLARDCFGLSEKAGKASAPTVNVALLTGNGGGQVQILAPPEDATGEITE